FLGDVVHEDRGALGGEAQRGRPPDPRARTGHERDLPLEQHRPPSRPADGGRNIRHLLYHPLTISIVSAWAGQVRASRIRTRCCSGASTTPTPPATGPRSAS